MNDSGPAIARFSFTNGPLRGSHLTLYPASLVHQGDTHLETVPLGAISAVRVSFQRNARRLGWGVVLVLAGLALLVVSAPLAGFAGGAAGEMAAAGAQGVTRVLIDVFRVIEAVASMLPVPAIACVIGGGALCAFGWIGNTLLQVSLPGTEREFSSRGGDTALRDFAEALTERVTLKR